MTNDKSDTPDEDTPAGLSAPADAAESGGKKVLSPEELDISDSEYVEKLDDNGRYVVSPGGGPPKVPDSVPDDTSNDTDPRFDGRTDSVSRETVSTDRRPSDRTVASPESARTLLSEELRRSNARYGLDIVGHFEGDTARHRTVSDDVIATFEDLVRWYAGHVTDGTPPDEVVDILLRESTFETGETPNLAKLLESHGLDQTDSIADLVAAIREEAKP